MCALHEAQSRFYENMLGRNINFWIPIYDDIKRMLKIDIPLEEFMKLLNTSECSKIRVDADELTYCMHIIVRYEIERELFKGNITVDELPEIWNNKMKEYLNQNIESDNEGLMQDVHWSDRGFGYFPSYLMGSVFDGMLLEHLNENLGDIDEFLKNGKIKEITNYLIENIYIYGGAYNSNEVINRLFKKEITSEPLIKYFKKKYY